METKSFTRKAMMLFTLILGINIASIAVDQQFKVTGKVTDCTGKAIPGVNVQIKGTTTGAITDLDGNYTIYVTSKDILVFSFIGMQTQKVQVTNKTVINVTLQNEKTKRSSQDQKVEPDVFPSLITY